MQALLYIPILIPDQAQSKLITGVSLRTTRAVTLPQRDTMAQNLYMIVVVRLVTSLTEHSIL